MRTVLGFNQNIVYVTFEDKLNEPWTQLGLIADAVPEVLDKQVRFSKRIPKDCEKYVLFDHFYNEVNVSETKNFREAVRFLKRREGYPLLRNLLEKHLAAANEN